MADPAGWKVLLIDDEADICEVMAYTLEDAGYQVQMAGNGEAGLARCESDPPQSSGLREGYFVPGRGG